MGNERRGGGSARRCRSFLHTRPSYQLEAALHAHQVALGHHPLQLGANLQCDAHRALRLRRNISRCRRHASGVERTSPAGARSDCAVLACLCQLTIPSLSLLPYVFSAGRERRVCGEGGGGAGAGRHDDLSARRRPRRHCQPLRVCRKPANPCGDGSRCQTTRGSVGWRREVARPGPSPPPTVPHPAACRWQERCCRCAP